MAEKDIILQGEDGQVDELVLTTTDASTDIALDDCTRLLFPQEGEAVPRLRFRGFEEKWIEAKLGDLFTERVECDADGEMLSVTMNNGVIKASDNGRYDNSNSDKSHYKVVKVNDIAYNSMRMWQGASGCSAYEGIVSPAYTVVTPVEGIDPHFFACLFKTPAVIKKFRLNSQGLTSDTWNLKFPAFSKISVLYPRDIDEQRKIASFLQRIDEQMTVYQKQFEELKQLKSACLETMFPKQNESVPTIRFKGYIDDWATTRLNEISKKVTRKNADLAVRITLTNSAEFGVVNQLDFFDHDVSNGDNIRGYYVVENDDFVYNPRISSSAPVGPINRNQLGYSGVMSPLYYVFKVDGIDKDYLSCFFKTNRWHKFMFDNGNTGARFDRLSISDDVFGQMPIRHPKDACEQKQIADFFNRLDSEISAQYQQLERLKQMKQSCLGLLFADNQSITPPSDSRDLTENGL